jgi:Na+-transporting NADH:ubiquinone oxidoreductase subunit B
MNKLSQYIDKNVAPLFNKGGKWEKYWSFFDAFHSFLFVPTTTAPRRGVQVHDSVDSKRVITTLIIALIPALLFGMWNEGYQHFTAIHQEAGFWECFFYGLLLFLPKVIVTYIVGLGIEFCIAAYKHEEVAEGFLASGILIPAVMPAETPLWTIALATAFAVVFAKEVFGGTGYNIFNPALIARAFLFFAYPTAMSGTDVFVRGGSALGFGGIDGVDAVSVATPLGMVAEGTFNPATFNTWDAFLGIIPGSFAETSTLAILIGACILIVSGVASWRIMLSCFAGGALMSAVIYVFADNAPTVAQQLCLGGFAFAAVFMATDPVTAARTNTGKWIYGCFVGVMAIVIRMFNTGYPEGAMLAVLLGNAVAPLIDYCVVQANINRRNKRAALVANA